MMFLSSLKRGFKAFYRHQVIYFLDIPRFLHVMPKTENYTSIPIGSRAAE